MDNEIKQGDKVRIANNAPSEYRYGFNYRLRTQESEVVELDDDGYMAAIVPMCVNDKDLWFQIPCKYLVKVDAEAKEANVKIGDKVIVHYPNGDRIGRIQEEMLDGTYDIDFGGGCTGHNITRSQIESYTTPTIKVGDRVKIKSECLDYDELIDDTYTFSVIPSEVIKIEDGIATLYMDGIPPKTLWAKVEVLETLVEPTEQTEAEKTDSVVPFSIFRNGGLSNPHIVNLHNGMHYWQCYEADLAKEVALKVANKFNAPEQAAEYAVKVAKSVVEGLKRM